jgi:hypothetical protein
MRRRAPFVSPRVCCPSPARPSATHTLAAAPRLPFGCGARHAPARLPRGRPLGPALAPMRRRCPLARCPLAPRVVRDGGAAAFFVTCFFALAPHGATRVGRKHVGSKGADRSLARWARESRGWVPPGLAAPRQVQRPRRRGGGSGGPRGRGPALEERAPARGLRRPEAPRCETLVARGGAPAPDSACAPASGAFRTKHRGGLPARGDAGHPRVCACVFVRRCARAHVCMCMPVHVCVCVLVCVFMCRQSISKSR